MNDAEQAAGAEAAPARSVQCPGPRLAPFVPVRVLGENGEDLANAGGILYLAFVPFLLLCFAYFFSARPRPVLCRTPQPPCRLNL